MAAPIQLRDRYELRQVLGRGGMGVVYSAYDSRMKREVALKTVLDIDNQVSLDLFFKEWGILAAMVHPNIVEIYDIGDFEQDGRKRPFFVMPLLPGVSLDKLIKEGSPRLTVDRVADIIVQACRGLQAAHEMGLVHRDVKPSNIFVMDDDAVKIIDFGIARSSMSDSRTSLKGTLSYIAPEQIQLKPPSAFSDQYALGVVTYEALTRRVPFRGASDPDVMDAILNQSPPAITELNSNVTFPISQVVHKALAKQPWHRFTSIKEFGETLQKAARREVLEQFDNTKVKPRLQRAVERYEQGDYEFALELITELESEGHLDQEIQLVKRQVDQAVRKTRIKTLLDNARRFMEAQEYSLALRKIQEALEIDPGDPDSLALKGVVEKERREKKIDEWIQIARQHLSNQAFQQAHDALENILKIKPDHTSALHLATELSRRSEDVERARSEKADLYNSAMQAWDRGEVTAAFSKLEVLGALEKASPDPDKARSSGYQSFYNQVRSEHDLQKNRYEEARQHLSNENFGQALAVCKQSLAKYPNHALFQALLYDVEDRRRQKLSAVIADTDRRADEEPDLDRRAALLDSVAKEYPGEQHFERALQLVRDKRDLVNSIVAKAQYFEEQQPPQLNEALDQWRILNSIHDSYPGLSFELERLEKRRDQQARENSKLRWVEQIDRLLESGDHDRAVKATKDALSEFPADAELTELSKLAQKMQERGNQAQELLARAREVADAEQPADQQSAKTEASLALLREAFQTDPKSSVIRTVLLNALLESARVLVNSDHEAAEPVLRELLELDPEHAAGRSLVSQAADRKREDFVSASLTEARRLQAEGDLEGALTVAKLGIETYPNENRLQQLSGALERNIADLAMHAASSAIREPEPTKESPAASTGVPLAGLNLSSLDIAPPVAAPKVVATPRTVAPPAPSPAVVVPEVASRRPLLMMWVAIAASVLLIAAFIFWRGRPAPLRTVLQTSPAGASLRVNGQECGTSTCELELAAGTYQVEATLEGYVTQTTSLEIGTATSPTGPVLLTLTPVPAVVAEAPPITAEPITTEAPIAPPTETPDAPKVESKQPVDDATKAAAKSRTQPKLVGIPDGTPFGIALSMAIPSNAQAGTPLRFTVTNDLIISGAVVVAKGSTVTGEVAQAARRRLIGGSKMTLRLLTVDAVDGRKYPIRALSARPAKPPAERPVDTGIKPTSDDLAASVGTVYIAYVDNDAIVTVPQ